MGRARRGSRDTAGTPATSALTAAGAAFTVHAYEHDARTAQEAGGYGGEAARALGVEPTRVHKTLLVSVDGRLVVAVVPVTSRVDLKAVAAAVGGKRAEMADPADAERATGYVVGGISPLGQRRRLETVVDVGALDHRTVLVSAGRRGLEIELAPADLVALTGATTAAVATRS
ncbi:Cys-tRNA(Pro) deacylase [Thalassiella azotivora]